jgi:hypothetical protein
MVGIPFKRLEKKIEKSILLDRKKKLLTQLEQSTSSRDILELSTMLLGHQIRSYTLCGNELISSALDVILKDKKVPESLCLLFNDVVLLVQKDDADSLLTDEDAAAGGAVVANATSIQKLKRCAMSKNILQYYKEGRV